MPELPQFHFYCDETSHVGHHYAAVSGILVRPYFADVIDDQIARLKIAHGKQATSEIKWESINKRDFPLYRDVVAYFGSLLEGNLIRYHVVICDMHAYDHRLRNEGSKVITVSKTYYQLLLHRCCRLYGDKAFIHVRPDTGECTAALPSLQPGLNADARRRFQLETNPIASINLTHSHSHGLMQMNDVIVGGVASHRNERHKKDGASPRKTELAEAIRVQIGVPNFTINTSWDRHATVWNWRSKESGALGPRSER